MSKRRSDRKRAAITESTSALEAPVPGAVRGSRLEYQIKLARRHIAGWPADVRAALRVSSPVPPPASAQIPALDAAVEGVVRGSALERQINAARRNLAAWPADVHTALRIDV